MPDVLTPEQRKLNMSRIRARDTTPEKKLRRMLWQNGIRGYRIHYDLIGKPDIVFVEKKIAVFIDGCYWRKCPVCFREPDTRKEFWMKKIESNVRRDEKVNEELKKEGWTVIRIWEHEIRKEPEKVIAGILSLL